MTDLTAATAEALPTPDDSAHGPRKVEADASATETRARTSAVIEVRDERSAVRRYTGTACAESLAADLERGHVHSDDEARELAADSDDEPEWSSVAEVAKAHYPVHVMLEPVWANTVRGAGLGVAAGIALKALDTTAGFYLADPRLAGLWVLYIGALIATRWSWLPFFAVLFFSIKAGVNPSILPMFFGAFVGVMAVGAALGAASGSVLGTLYGLLRAQFGPQACDAQPRYGQALGWGLLAPGAFLAVAVWSYIRWIEPWLMETLVE